MDAGLALAPDTFQIVLDSENEAKGGHRSHSHSPELCGEQAAVGRDPRGGREPPVTSPVIQSGHCWASCA